MATNRSPIKHNMITGSTEPLVMLGLFQAGSTAAVKRGEIIELTADTNTKWVPIDSDYDMTSTSDAVAVANEEIKDGDRAGYYEIIVPRPGDVFEFELATAGANAIGTALYYSDSETLTTSGQNVIGYVCGQDHYPTKQGHLADDASPDQGTTIKSQSYVQMTFKKADSYYGLIEQ